MNRDLSKDPRYKTDLCCIDGSGVKTLHHLEERGLLFHSREELKLQREFHRESIPALLLRVEGKVCPAGTPCFLPGLHARISSTEVWLFRSISSPCVHADFPATLYESALSSRAS